MAAATTLENDIINILKIQNEQWATGNAQLYPMEHQDPKDAQTLEFQSLLSSDADPGMIFTHRNIANQVFPDDPNVMSVIAYALHDLGVEHIIVAGHSLCGGVAACIDKHLTQKERADCFEFEAASRWPPRAPLDQWLAPLRDFAESLDTPPTVQQLVEENVRLQVKKLIALPTVQDAWYNVDETLEKADKETKARLQGIHGWWFDVHTGRVRDLNISVHAQDILGAQS
ncbi:hypothetical protein NM688_g1223 [Phlebia brevispora]|uniref:Uncharacterized protein n=1 Tax=Phlebia brevispora TaxID=194682 RepID=A0ACC1TBW7_9APHY|nr:hypothetical protein NM688_g1223 [Phlebia brevispora]